MGALVSFERLNQALDTITPTQPVLHMSSDSKPLHLAVVLCALQLPSALWCLSLPSATC